MQHYLHVQLGAGLLAATKDALLAELATEQSEAETQQQRQRQRVQALEDERLKLIQAHYADAIPLDLLKREQQRIGRELAAAQGELDKAAVAFDRVEATLAEAVRLSADCHLAYVAAIPHQRRLMNQAFFKRLLITENGIVGWELAEPFTSLLSPGLSQYLHQLDAQAAASAPAQPRRGRGNSERTWIPHFRARRSSSCVTRPTRGDRHRADAVKRGLG